MPALLPAGIRSLALAVPTDSREMTLPNGLTVWRHFLSSSPSGLDLELQAAEEALELAGLEAADVDLVLSASFPALPEPCIGNATPLAFALGMREAAAFNVECACAGGLVALRNACQEVALGNYRNVLVTVMCPYSPTVEPGHPALTVIGDAAFAMVVGPTKEGQGFEGAVLRNSGPTCELVSWGVSDKTPSGIRLEVSGATAGQLESWAQGEIPDLLERLLAQTGVTRGDIDHWALNAPTPSFVDRTLETMGMTPSHGINTNRLLGNIGPALIGASLFYGAYLRDYQPGDLVLCCSVGSEASLALGLMRWPEGVALGKVPAHATLDQMRAFEAERLGSVASAA
jgi:3-oxoacyl-[acyl-carrier-protein] synthase-3